MREYQVLVKPGSSQEKVMAGESGELVVYLRAKPHGGEANEALVRVLAKYFGVAKGRVAILRGRHFRRKVVGVL